MAEITKVGIIACSGEEIPAGTISRLATRRVLELLRPESTVTLCLPLFLAGEEQERRFARQHPTITVDGCDKLCAKRGTEQYSGQVAASLVVTDILGDLVGKCHRSARDFDKPDEEAVWIVAERISEAVDALASVAPPSEQLEAGEAVTCCSCGSAPPEAKVTVGGKVVTVSVLLLIFDQLCKEGLEPTGGFADRVLEMVKIYHAIEPEEESTYREALAVAYRQYCQGGSRQGSGGTDSVP